METVMLRGAPSLTGLSKVSFRSESSSQARRGSAGITGSAWIHGHVIVAVSSGLTEESAQLEDCEGTPTFGVTTHSLLVRASDAVGNHDQHRAAVAHFLECMSSIHEAWCSSPSAAETGLMAHTSNHSTLDRR